MQRFIPLNKHRSSYIYVTRYNWPIEEKLKGKAILVRVNCLDDIVNITKHLDDTTKITGFIYENKYASLDTIDINPQWGKTPVILFINRLGQYREIHHKISLLRSLNVMVIFTGKEEQACTDAQILSSLGVHTGINIEKNSELSDSVLDLITYNFYGTCPHAPIEPFATMCKYYDGESYVSPELARFINPLRYLYVDKEMHIAFSEENLNNPDGNKFPIDIVETQQLSEEVEKEYNKWENFFIQSHSCTFCQAFRICKAYFNNEDKSRCQEIMSELLDAIEFQKKTQQNKSIETCQP